MKAKDVLSQLLSSHNKYHRNKELLKKIILTTYLGRLRINSLAPDKDYTLADYLLDEEKLIFDFTRLSDDKCKAFKRWLLEPHQQQKSNIFLNRVAVNEYRGYTAEVELSYWGKFKSWLTRKKIDHWKLAEANISTNYQLTGLNICHGLKGILIGLNQTFAPSKKGKYHDPCDNSQDSFGNAKRIYITDKLVDRLINSNYNRIDYHNICFRPHPQSLYVNNSDERYQRMHNYRTAERFHAKKPWFKRLFDWIKNKFRKMFGLPTTYHKHKLKVVDDSINERIYKPSEVKNKTENSFQKGELKPLIRTKKIKVYENTKSGKVLVFEKRPDINIMVFCGGGPKIFYHIGVFKAFVDAGIKPKKYAGSSSGAIMALLCYLGYSPDEIHNFFKNFKQKHLVYFQVGRNGLSDTNKLQTHLDSMIAKKVFAICKKYGGRLPKAKITFAYLEKLRKKYPGCGLGEQLVVTATHKKIRQTRYFSLKHTPNTEVSQAVCASACLPIVFKPVMINDIEYNDGGILSNFPTETYSDDYSTLLQSEHGNNLRLIGVQFNNGVERKVLNKIKSKVYRENPVVNWLYQLITGVKDPASGWEQDRIKLREHALQSILIDVKKRIPIYRFSIKPEDQEYRIREGYKPALEHIKLRYSVNEDGKYQNEEVMYSSFDSLGDLLAYCCYRENKIWFDRVYDLIYKSNHDNRLELLSQAKHLKDLYFLDKRSKGNYKPTVFHHNKNIIKRNNITLRPQFQLFLAIYPILSHKIDSNWFETRADRSNFRKAKYYLDLTSPTKSLEFIEKIKGKTHLIWYIFQKLCLSISKENKKDLIGQLKKMDKIIDDLPSDSSLIKQWNLDLKDCCKIIDLCYEQEIDEALSLCSYKRDIPQSTPKLKVGSYKEKLINREDEIDKTAVKKRSNSV